MILVYLEWTTSGTSHNDTAKLDGEKSIGRKSSNTFVIDDRQVSGEQAKLYDVNGKVMLKNVSKTNNIQVGGTVVTKNGGTATLTDQVTLKMGGTDIYTRISEVADGTANFVSCTTCAKPIAEGTTTCQWCNSEQSGVDATYTMV